MKYYYGVEFVSSRSTTTGEPHFKLGNHSIACNFKAFQTKQERDKWVDAGETTLCMRGNCREKITKRGMRELSRGKTMSQYNEEYEYMILDAETR